MISHPNKWGVLKQQCYAIIALLAFLVLPALVHANHDIGAEFRYTAISEFTYQIELIYYTRLSSVADRDELLIYYGDGLMDTVPRTLITDYLDLNIRVSSYSIEHTYSGYGNYIMTMEDPNRNAGIVNIPGSVSVPLSVDALIVIDPVLGMNNSIRFDSLQTNWYMSWNTLVHEPGANETESDSVIYELVTPLGLGNAPIPGYADPSVFTSNYVWVNPATGRFLWNQPTVTGEYVIAIRGTEYRNGQLIGQVTRDVEIQVEPQMLMVGVTELGSTNTLNIQPSLASSEIQFDSGSAGNGTAQLFDATGALVSTLTLTAGINTYALSDLDPGMYVLRIRTCEGRTQVGRFVKE